MTRAGAVIVVATAALAGGAAGVTFGWRRGRAAGVEAHRAFVRALAPDVDARIAAVMRQDDRGRLVS